MKSLAILPMLTLVALSAIAQAPSPRVPHRLQQRVLAYLLIQ